MGIWRHKKRIHQQNIEDVGNCDISGEKMLIDKNEYIKLLETAVHNKQTVNNNISTQNNNQHISINVFLNEHCKDAMCIEDFMKKIHLTLKDLDNTNQLGYVDGISNIIIKGLEDLPSTTRPIHSTDTKRNKFVVKKTDGWEKDDGTEVDKAVRDVKLKHITVLSKWEEEHPNFQTNSKELEEWQNIIQTLGEGDTSAVRKKIANVIHIKDAINKTIKE